MWRRPLVRHAVKAVDRFSARLGWQFAAALTYFSFLAVVPIVMVSFSVAGFVLASKPALITSLQHSITSLLPGSLAADVSTLLTEAVDARLTVGVIGLVFAIYSGISWMGNLRSAIQAMWRPDFDTEQEIAAESLGRYYLKSAGYMVALTAGIAVSLGLTTIGTSAQNLVLRWLGLDKITWLTPVFTVVPILLAVAADMLIFLGIFRILPPKAYPAPRKALLRGAAVTAIAFEVLKVALTFLLPTLLRSATAKIFGPIIGLLIFFNLVANVVLFVAAWIATSRGSRAGDSPVPLANAPHGALAHRRAAAMQDIHLSEATAVEMDKLADVDGRSREDLVQDAVVRYLAARRHE
ncbi:membrane protein [Nakamurella sp. UYEF19]|uniref:YhjD/YihY/BrkB family envelope integrity protein n=1 Tax=Nakamurella sp. UYEF19 TaxID=1756392 RepID=UPI003395BC4C